MGKLKKILMIVMLTFAAPVGKGALLIKDAHKQAFEDKFKATKKTVLKLAPHLSPDRQTKVALAINKNSAKFNIPEKVLFSIIKVESNFKSEKISETGDYSIVQINLKIWNKEFKRLGLPTINKAELVKNDEYAISMMCNILNLIKSRHNKDKQWYARYHSNTREYNRIYNRKIDKVMRLIASN